MSALGLLNLLNPMKKCIYLYHKKYVKKQTKKHQQQQKTFIKQIAGQLIQDTNLITILMYHMLLHKAQTQQEVIFMPQL